MPCLLRVRVAVLLVAAATILGSAPCGVDASFDSREWTFDERYLPGPSRWMFITNLTDGSARFPFCAEDPSLLTAPLFIAEQAKLAMKVPAGSASSLPAPRIQQSPINLRAVPSDAEASSSATPFLDLQLPEANNVTLSNDGTVAAVTMIDAIGLLSVPSLFSKPLVLANMTIHMRSGHTVGSASFPGELQFWFIKAASPSVPNAPIAAVVSVFVDIGTDSHEVIAQLLSRLPVAPDVDATTASRRPQASSVNLRLPWQPSRLVPTPLDAVTYMGGLDMPPCAAVSVLRIVVPKPIRISRPQYQELRARLRLDGARFPGPLITYASNSRRAQMWKSPNTYATVQRAMNRADAANRFPPAPGAEPLTFDAILSLAGVVVASTGMAVAAAALVAAICYPRRAFADWSGRSSK